jgi:uncharacterized repeat protein (TIGR02543 family)
MAKKIFMHLTYTVIMFGMVLALGTMVSGCPQPDDPLPPPKYTVYFDAKGGTVSVPSITVQVGSTLGDSLPEPTKNGYTFWGWYTGDGTDGEDWGYIFIDTTPVTGDLTVYARWGSGSPTKHTVTFNTKGGNNIAPIEVIENDKLGASLPVPTKTDYTFNGWYTKDGTGNDWGTEFTGETPVTGAITLYAQWTKKPGGGPGTPNGAGGVSEGPNDTLVIEADVYYLNQNTGKIEKATSLNEENIYIIPGHQSLGDWEPTQQTRVGTITNGHLSVIIPRPADTDLELVSDFAKAEYWVEEGGTPHLTVTGGNQKWGGSFHLVTVEDEEPDEYIELLEDDYTIERGEDEDYWISPDILYEFHYATEPATIKGTIDFGEGGEEFTINIDIHMQPGWNSSTTSWSGYDTQNPGPNAKWIKYEY